MKLRANSAKLPSTECRPARPRRNRVAWKSDAKTPCNQRKATAARNNNLTEKTSCALSAPHAAPEAP